MSLSKFSTAACVDKIPPPPQQIFAGEKHLSHYLATLHPYVYNILKSKRVYITNLINEKDATLLSIFAETPGCFELDRDAGDPNAQFLVYVKSTRVR